MFVELATEVIGSSQELIEKCLIDYAKYAGFEETDFSEGSFGVLKTYTQKTYNITLVHIYSNYTKINSIVICAPSSEESIEYAFRVASDLRKKCHVNE